MRTATLRTVGGSTVVVIPPAMLEQLGLSSKAKVSLRVERGRLIVEPNKRPRYTLEELLAQCDPKAKRSKELEEWLNAPSVGKEII